MKKVLVLAAAVALFATPAMALISTTAHDLSAANNVSSTVTEICVFCHTPHGADTTVTLAPLWNRTTVNAAGTTYVGLDIQASYDLTSINQTDAPLCLSCHDGATLMDALNNPANSGGTFASAIAAGDAVLDTDLSNDHPIGFDFSVINAADTGIKTLAAATASGAKFYGASNNEMWCSSCHDVHNDGTGVPFLNVSNVNSGLCLACHNK
jgi:cytochrome c553